MDWNEWRDHRASGQRLGPFSRFVLDAGYGYLQKVHSDPQDPEVLRVFPVLSSEQLSTEEVPALTQGPEAYFILDPDTRLLASQDWVRIVGPSSVPPELQRVPPLRFTWDRDSPRGSVLVDGKQLFLERFSPEQEKWSLNQYPPSQEIRRWIANQWRLEDYEPPLPMTGPWEMELHLIHLDPRGLDPLREAVSQVAYLAVRGLRRVWRKP